MTKRYKSIYGWSTEQEQGALILRLLPLLPQKINIAEIGAFYGRTTVLICDMLKDERREYVYTAVDNYVNSKHVDIQERIKAACNEVKADLIQGDLSKPDKIKDASLDLVYIDCPDAAKFKSIIKAWISKLKVGGIISGNMQDPVIKTAVANLFEEWDWVNNQFYVIKGKNHDGQH